MDKLTPTARMTLDALRAGPGNVHELSARTGRSRSATDKALGELTKANLIEKVDNDRDPADGAPTRWQLTGPRPADEPASKADTGDGNPPQQSKVDESDADQPTAAPADATGPATQAGLQDPAAAAEPITPHITHDTTTPNDAADGPPPPQDNVPQAHNSGTADQPGTAEGDLDADGQVTEAEEPKLCRGCQAQMPKVCPGCWQKTPAYCGQCRKHLPQVRRGEPGEPMLLANGLPKLRHGELEAMVEKVLRDNPLPHHVGVTGWTSGRVAVFLPGRSTGAISNALRKLTKTGVAQLIGEHPERYQLVASAASDAVVSATTAVVDGAEPVAVNADATAAQ